MNARIIELPKIPDQRGNLTFIEEQRHIPFKIERSFWSNTALPITEKIHAEELSLPINPVLNIEDAKQIVNLINTFE